MSSSGNGVKFIGMKHPSKQSHRKVAIFDIDGTIFRSSLLIEITEALISAGLFPTKVRQVYARDFANWFNRKGSYEKYIMTVVSAFENNIKGVNRQDLLKITQEVISFNQHRVYRYTRELVKDLKKKNYYLLAISNSPKEILDAFCSKLGFDKVYGRIYEVDGRGKFTGKTLFADLISDKSKILKRAILHYNLTLKGSVGVGDSESDIAFLKMVENPICFNPNAKLYRHARRSGWKVVVERKDVVYKIKNHNF